MRAGGSAAAAALCAVLTLGVAAPASAAERDDDHVLVTVEVPDVGQGPDTGPARLTNAELRWAVNAESGSANYVGCNFLMAGIPGTNGDSGGSRIWSAADARLYRAVEGDVEILRPHPGGADGERRASFADRCTDPDGAPLTMSAHNTSQAEVVITGGRGERQDDGSLEVRWTGSFTVVFYGGMTYWWATDPVLRLDARGNGSLTATAGGYAADREDVTRWSRLPDTQVALATFTGARLGTRGDGGHLTPDWCGVRAAVGSGSPQLRERTGDLCWGSFPQSLISFHELTGQGSYWYTSGHRDVYKPPAPVTFSVDADNSLGRPEGTGTGPGGGGTGTGGAAAPGGTAGGPPGGLGPAPSSGPAGADSAGGRAPGSLGGPGLAAAPVALPALEDDLAFFPATAAETFGARGAGLVPELGEVAASSRVLLGLAGLLIGTAATVIGFRRGWLVLPFR